MMLVMYSPLWQRLEPPRPNNKRPSGLSCLPGLPRPGLR